MPLGNRAFEYSEREFYARFKTTSSSPNLWLFLSVRIRFFPDFRRGRSPSRWDLF